MGAALLEDSLDELFREVGDDFDCGMGHLLIQHLLGEFQMRLGVDGDSDESLENMSVFLFEEPE